MLIQFFTFQAEKLFFLRWWFLLIALIGIAVLILSMQCVPAKAAYIFPFVIPFVAVPWGLLCMCIWFHPTKGKLSSSSKFIGKFPSLLQTIVRWYFAIFLVIFLVFGLFAFPIFGIFIIGQT